MDRRNAWKPALRMVASVAMLAVLVPRVHLSRMVPAWRPSTMAWLAAALVMSLVGVLLSAVRWQRALAAVELPARVSGLVTTYLASLFVGNFLPSTIGGDVLRVTRLSASNGQTPRTFASVILERMSGWVVLPFLSLSALVINPGLRRAAPRATSLAISACVFTLLLLAVVLVVASSSKLGGRLASNEGWRRFTGAVHLGLGEFRRRPGLALELVTVALAYQLAVMMSAFLGAHVLGLQIGWTAILAFLPVVAILQVVSPLMGGLGVREGALVFFLHELGVSTNEAIAFGLLVYGVNLIVSLLGAPAFAVGSKPARVAV